MVTINGRTISKVCKLCGIRHGVKKVVRADYPTVAENGLCDICEELYTPGVFQAVIPVEEYNGIHPEPPFKLVRQEI